MAYCDKLVFKDRILSKSKINALRNKGVKVRLAADVKVEPLEDISLVDTNDGKLYPLVTLYDGVHYILQGDTAPGKEAILISKIVLKNMLYNPADNRV